MPKSKLAIQNNVGQPPSAVPHLRLAWKSYAESDVGFIMVRLSKIARWGRRLWLPLPWGGEPRQIIVDLRGVRSRDDFQRELSRHFLIAEDHRDLWNSLQQALMIDQPGPLRLRFLGWSGFRERMPRYARRLYRILEDHHRLWGDRIGGVRLLTVEFA